MFVRMNLHIDIGNGSEDKWSSKISIHSDPRTPRGLHFVQLAMHRTILKTANSSADDSQYSYPYSGISRSPGKSILGIFLLVLGATLMKLAFYFGDTPRPQRDDRWLTWGIGCIAALLIAQGTILALSSNWLP